MYPDTFRCNRSFGMSSAEVMELDKDLMRDNLDWKLQSRYSFQDHIDPSV